jgi:peroxiredoxin-like protein
MHPLPHRYEVNAEAKPAGSVNLSGDRLPALPSMPPPQFGGPGGQWAPETLFIGAVADCFILTFRAIAEASKFSWHDVACHAEGTVDKGDGGVQFTEIRLHARLSIPADADAARAERLLEKAKQNCLVTNSLKHEPTLTLEVSSSS